MNRVAEDEFDDDDWSEESYSESDPDFDPYDQKDLPEVSCPHCQANLIEDSPYCSQCGHWVSKEDSAESKPRWLIIGLLFCLLAALMMAFS